MRKLGKSILWTLIIGAVGGSAFVIPTIWFKPWVIDHFYTRVFARFALQHPMMLSSLRILEPMGLYFHNDELDDASIAFQKKEAQWLDEQIQILYQYDRESLSEAERLSYDILEWFMLDAQASNRFMFHNYPINQLSGVHTSLPAFMTTTHQVGNEREAEDYISRLEGFKTYFDQTIKGLRHREKMGILPPRWVYPKVLEEIGKVAGAVPKKTVLYTHLSDRLDKLDISEVRRNALLAEAEHTIASSVIPVYEKLHEVMADQRTRATDDDGVWKLPDGRAFYDQQLRHHTTTRLTAEHIHQLGLSEVARNTAEMRQLFEAEGYDVDALGGIGAAMQALSQEERFRYPDTDAGRQRIIDDFAQMVKKADGALDTVFDLRPKAAVEVVRTPEFMQENSSGAYYNAPPFDGSKPGRFYVNLRNVNEHTRFNMRTLAYHEAIPGHHYQIALAQEMKNVPFFRRIIPFTAYAEGWAHYSETVADEAGFHPDAYSRLGYLQAQLMRAVRLVVDTGIHAKRWTRDQAITYMLENTGIEKTDVVAEIERYIVNPGQACAYKVGQLKILELRRSAQDRLGNSFDVRTFHNVVLRNGAMPLSLLETQVDAWIKSTSKP